MSRLSDAITAVEAAQSDLDTAKTATTNTKLLVAETLAKLSGEETQEAADEAAEKAKATSLNASLDELIAAATEAKIPTS